MSQQREKTISLVQAARLLYRTKSPTAHQVDRVFGLMRSGDLDAYDGGTSPQRWTTTDRAIAEYLALRRVERNADRRSPSRDAKHGLADDFFKAKSHDHLNPLYHGIWRDYFLALMLRRRVAHRGVAFRRAVLAGQVLLLSLLVAVMCGSFFAIRESVTAPAEHVAVARWIEKNTDAYAIETWHPAHHAPDGPGLVLTVEYRYRKNSQRWIHTKRTFKVEGDLVEELAMDG